MQDCCGSLKVSAGTQILSIFLLCHHQHASWSKMATEVLAIVFLLLAGTRRLGQGWVQWKDKRIPCKPPNNFHLHFIGHSVYMESWDKGVEGGK